MSNNILLTVYTYVDGVSDTPFPNAENPLKIKYTYNAQRMGSSSLTATAMYPTCLDDLWVSGKQYVDFKGERYFIVKTPSSSKSNDDVRYKHELEFLSGRSVLDNVYVYDVVTGNAGSTDRYVSNSTKVLFYGDIQEFVARLNFSLEYSNLAYRIVIDEGITSEAKQVSLENVFFSNALQEIFNIFELPFYFVGTTIHVGFTNNAITHTFKYGKDFELLSVSKTNANYKITNRVTGTGSSDNIQFYYPNPSNDRKAIEEAGGTWITPSQVLMPPIYRQTNGAERFYNALNNKYINPDTGDYYTFENLYLPTNPKEQIVDFSYIKPSIKNALNKAGVRMDMIKAIAFDQNDDDSINKDTGEYVHSYFYVKLNKFDGDFGFNLFDQALVGSDATVSMTSGACGACNFQIGVTEITQEGKQVFRNPVQVDSKGDIVPGDYAQKVNVNNLQPQQQNTMTNEVWIALKKDNTTFGIVMPNAGNNIKPSVGDSFVFLNIDMPQAYITKAEKELEEAIIKYMANNNREKFTFSIKLSRIFLAENPSIGNLLNENARIDLEYNGQFHQLYVSNYTLKVDENVLPEISIQLTDTLTIGKNSLQTAIDGVKQDIMNSIGSVDFLKQGLKYFLRKDTSDYARDFITFLRGLKVGSYTEGGNSGGIFAVDANGKTYIETDMLKVRAKAYFETLEIINTNSIGGRQIITPGGSITCNKVVEGDTYYRCYFVNDADNTPIENRFKVDDQALSQDFNIKEGIYENVSNHYYWRKVVAIGEDYIDLSKTDADVSSDIPKAGDVICQLGNKTDKTRQNAIIFSAVDFYSPSITLYAGIDSYSYVNKEYVSYGVDKTTNEAFFNVYGRMYVGDRNKNSYMQYSEKDGLQIKGKLQVGTTIGSGQTVEDALEQTKNDAIAGAKENLDKFATTVNGSLKDLQDQIDGAIETWFYDPVPTLTNQPAVNWTTDKDKNTHLGDLYYDGNGKAYRFQLTDATYEWKVITDSDITKALADAKNAQDTADSKRKIFVRQPLDTETYEVGDLWVNATFGNTYSNDVLRCKTAKAAGTSFSINHWEKASKYTDDQAALEAQRLAKAAQADVDQAKRDINGLDGEVDGLRNFTDQAFKDGVIDRSEATAIAKYLNNIETSQKDVSQSFAKVYNNPLLSGIAKTNLNNANIAFNTAATDLISTIRAAIADGITTNTEKAAVDDKYSVFNTKYGDYIAYLNEANKFIQDQIKTTADNALQKAVDLNYLKQAFKEETTITNGVVQTSILALGYTDGSSYKIMSGSNGVYDSSKIGGGIASWWGGSMKDRNDYTSESMPSDVAKGLVRFDGTGYFANGNLWWDNNGKLHADPLSFLVGPENVGDLLSIFQIVKSGTSINYVVPRYPFQKLSISSYLELGSGYRIKVDEANNAIYFEKADGGIVNFYATGGITALGVGTKSPQTILDALPIDTNTLSKEGGKLTVIGGGSGGNTGSISLNGQRYDSVDGVITLPNLATPGDITTALNGYATQAWVTDKNYATQSWVNGKGYVTTTALATMGFATRAWVNSQGFLSSAALDNYVTLDTVQNITGVKTFSSGLIATVIVANKFKTLSGTSSQFLKADGSVDRNLYALAYEGNQNKTQHSQYSRFTDYVQVIDRRSDIPSPNSYETHNISAFFNASNGMPDGNWWSGFHVRGWGDGYCTWELVGPSSTNNTAYNLRYRTGIGDTWGAWKMIMTDVEADGKYVFKTGDTMTGRLTAPDVFATTLWATSTLRSNLLLTVGASNNIIAANRAELHLITPSDNPCDLWMGANNSRRWSITARPSQENYQLGIYNNTRANWNVIFRDDINDFYAKTEVRSTFLVIPSDVGGGYNEGIRICNGSNNWSNIQFGAQNAWNGKVDGQWIVGKNPVKNFQICLAGTETSNGSRPSKGIHIDINGYLHTSYVSTEINPDNQGDYFYSSDDTFLRRSTWYAALSHLSNKQQTLDLTTLDQNKWYPCIIKAPAYGGTPLRITLFNGLRGNKPTWGSHPYGFSLLLDYEVTGSGWGTLAAVAKLNWYFGSYGGETAFGGRQQNTMASEEIIYLRGGGLYYYRTTNAQSLTVYPNGYTWNPGSYNYSAAVKTSQDNSPMERTFDQVYWLPATLRETRTFWGQPFNGSQNVSGALSGVTTINASNTIYTAGDISNGGSTYCNGRLYVDRGRYSVTASPAISLAIGDSDTGFHWSSDGAVDIYSNAAAVGGWTESQFRYGHGYLKNATGNDYYTLGIMVNGNGTANSIKPGIGFHQPGVYAGSIRMNDSGSFGIYTQGGTGLANLSLNAWYTNHGYINGDGIYLTNGWFRTHGTTGWYNQTYGGGMYMTDSDQVQVFNNKVFYNTGYRSWGIGGHFCALKLYNASHIGLNLANNSYTWGIYSNNDGNMYIGRRDGNVNNTSGTYVVTIGLSTFSMSGNIVATGGITAKTSSDEHLKNLLPRSNYAEKLLSLGNVFDFVYNETAKRREGKQVDGAAHTGLSYQKVSSIMPTICGKDPDGYGWINYIHPDFVSLIAGATQLNTLGIKELYKKTNSIEDEIKKLKKENERLKKEVNKLKKEYR